MSVEDGMPGSERVERLFEEAFASASAGDTRRALALYDQVTDLAPDLRAAWFNKAILYEHRLREPFEAIGCYLRAVDIEPSDLASTRSIGVLYYRNGQFKKARYWLEKLINWGERHHDLTRMYERSMEEGQGRDLAFISYSWRDMDRADRLCVALDAASSEYFIDQSRIPQAESLPALRWQIEQGLAQSDLAIVLWSRDAARSRWVCLELCSATAMLKKIVIVRLDDTALPESIERGIRRDRIRAVSVAHDRDWADAVNAVGHLRSRDDVIRRNESSRVETISCGSETLELVALHGGNLADFAIGKFPVTQGQWRALMRDNPAGHVGDLTRPVENVSWQDAHAFLEKLAAGTGKRLRLPSDVEWEYACRAGNVGNWSCGDDENALLAYAWCMDNAGGSWPGVDPGLSAYGIVHRLGSDGSDIRMEVSLHETNPVHTKQPNRWGLFHMHGNVREWCEDADPGDVHCRITRGGSFRNAPLNLRSSARLPLAPHLRGDDLGFRVAFTSD